MRIHNALIRTYENKKIVFGWVLQCSAQCMASANAHVLIVCVCVEVCVSHCDSKCRVNANVYAMHATENIRCQRHTIPARSEIYKLRLCCLPSPIVRMHTQHGHTYHMRVFRLVRLQSLCSTMHLCLHYRLTSCLIISVFCCCCCHSNILLMLCICGTVLIKSLTIDRLVVYRIYMYIWKPERT